MCRSVGAVHEFLCKMECWRVVGQENTCANRPIEKQKVVLEFSKAVRC
jgi:hypothetical protein